MDNCIKKRTLNFSKSYLFSIIVVLICVFPLFKFEYSTDTYHFALHQGVNGVCGAMKSNGRLLIYGITKIFSIMSMSLNVFYYFSFFLSIVFAALSITTVYFMLEGHITKKLAYFLSIISILNPMVFELFLFIEKGFFMFAVYMSVLSCKFFLKFLQGEHRYLFFAYPLLILSCFTYQPMPGVFVAFALVFIVAYSKNSKQYIANTGVAISLYFVATIANFIVMHLMDLGNRLSEGLNFMNIYKFLTFGVYNPYFLFVYLGVFLTLFLIVFLTFKHKTGRAFSKESAFVFFKYSFIIVGTIVVTAAPSVATTPENVFFTLRYSYPIGTLVGTIPILYNYQTESIAEDSRDPKLGKGTVIVMISVLVVFLTLFLLFFFGRHLTNARDKDDALRIGEIISNYEKTTGMEVKYIALYRDSNCSTTFEGVVSLPNCNIRAITTPWCDVPHINLFSNRKLKEVEPSKKYSEYFSKMDETEINNKLFVFEGNTLHLGIY